MVALTTVQITNVTGKKVNFVTYHNYFGYIKPGTEYPPVIENGETVYFVFENQNGDESTGAVVYQGENEEGSKFQWLYAWYNKDGTHKAYTVIADANEAWKWGEIQRRFIAAGTTSHAEYEHCVSHAIISQPLYPVIYQGRMSLKGGSTT